VALTDGEQLARQFPATFTIPTAERRQTLTSGSIVKLGFWPSVALDGDPNAERMWVRVDLIEDDADGILYIGSLANEPMVVVDLERGDMIRFRPKNVLSIWG
jgi:uncharacterized protein YegJ (DUF2314 family)